MSFLTKEIETKDGIIIILTVAFIATSVISIYAINTVNIMLDIIVK